MTKEENNAVEKCNFQMDLIADDWQNHFPYARVWKSGPYIFAEFEGSTWMIQMIAPNTFDVIGTFGDGEKFDRQGLTQDQVELLLQTIYFRENPETVPASPTWEKQPVSEDTSPEDPQAYAPAKGSTARVSSRPVEGVTGDGKPFCEDDGTAPAVTGSMSTANLEHVIDQVLREYLSEDAAQAAEDAQENPTHAQTPATGSASPTPTNEGRFFVFPSKKAKRPIAANEETATDAVQGYDTARAFSDPRQKINRGTEQSEREGWQRIMSEDDQLVVCSGSVAPPQPNQQQPMNEAANWQLRKLVDDLRDKLPVEPEDISIDATGSDAFPQTNIVIEKGDLVVRILPKDDTGTLFDVETLVGSRRLPRKTALRYGAMISFVFDCVGIDDSTSEIVSGIGTEKENPALWGSDDNEIVTTSDAYSVLKELAGEAGQPTDIFRNKSLFDLRGLAAPKPITKQPFITLREQLAEKFDPKSEPAKLPIREQSVPRNLRGENLKNGAPVSLNENRDLTRPYKSTLGGKKLVMHPIHGAILVDKDALPEGKKLSWDKEHGAVMINESQQTIRPNWKAHWQKDY